jgi:hypothetical protein
MITEKMIEAHARADAAFSERDFDGMSADAKRSYFERSKVCMTAALAAGDAEPTEPTFLQKLVENAFSWGKQDCNYLNPKHIDAFIGATKNGMLPEQAATWVADGLPTKTDEAEPVDWQYFCDGKWRHSTNPTYLRETGYPMRALYASPVRSPSDPEQKPAAWQCDECGGRQCARMDERQPDGRFASGPDGRCIECKKVHAGVFASPVRSAQEAVKVRHKKRGTTYEVIDTGRLQVDGDLDMEKVTIYRGEDGQVWVRPDYEFNDGRFEAVPALLPPGGETDTAPSPSTRLVGDIVPPHCTGSALAFEPGVLHVNKDGSGYIAINEDAFVLEDDRCEGPDGPEGSVHWIARMDASEIIALRDFLNGNTTADRLADKIEDLISEFGNDPKSALECVSEHLQLRRHAIRARAALAAITTSQEINNAR